MSRRFFISAALLMYGLSSALSIRAADPDSQPSPSPLVRGHAHNDYLHEHPLFDALAQGYCSVEADIFLINGKLLVAHTIFGVRAERTLESLYLDPMRAQVKKNGGHLYPGGPECVLLIEIKSEGAPTYAALKKVLSRYTDILTVFRDRAKETNAITAILTGNYPRNLLAADKIRLAAGDGDLSDLEKNPPANLVPWISDDWIREFTWRGHGPMKETERAKLKDFVARTHAQGRKLRFWGSPDHAGFWKELLDDGVDWINTDDLKGFAKFYWDWKAGKKSP